MFDLTPATLAVARVVSSVRDDQLDAPTPNPGRSVASMLSHIDGFCLGFRAAAH